MVRFIRYLLHCQCCHLFSYADQLLCHGTAFGIFEITREQGLPRRRFLCNSFHVEKPFGSAPDSMRCMNSKPDIDSIVSKSGSSSTEVARYWAMPKGYAWKPDQATSCKATCGCTPRAAQISRVRSGAFKVELGPRPLPEAAVPLTVFELVTKG